MRTLRDFLGFVMLALAACALGRCMAPAPQPSVLVDTPNPSAAPIDDLNLNGATDA